MLCQNSCKYLDKLSMDAKEADVFYLTPVSKVTDLSKPWIRYL